MTSLPNPIPPSAWDFFVTAHPAAHILQTSLWGALKAQFGWDDERVTLTDGEHILAGAQILYRRLPFGLGRFAYIPKGPLVDWADTAQTQALVAALDRAACMRGAIALTIEPDLPDEPQHHERLAALGFRPAPFSSVQPRRTLVVDISGDEDTILAAMRQKTRYNVRLAMRKGVTVREAGEADLPAFYALNAATARRDRFGVHEPAYYKAVYRLFVPPGWARLLLAEIEGEPVAALMVFALGRRAWYFYGASGDAHREKMAPYLLQWEAMRWARAKGCTEYDLWGVPDEDEATLEAQFEQRQDGLWGVYRFKRGFGGRLVRSVGAWDRIYRPLLYRLYRWAITLRRHQ